MSITMIPQPSGMVLPRCSICGQDIVCRDFASRQGISSYGQGGIEVWPQNLGRDLVGTGLQADDLTCSTCFQQTDLNGNP